MSEDRWKSLSDAIHEDATESLLGDRVARVAAHLFHADSTSVTAWSVPSFLTLAATNPRAHALDQQQLVLGEGPIFDVSETDTPSYTPDILGDDCTNRWPLLSRELSSNNVASMFCFPLRIGSAHVGAITAYRDILGAPTPEMYRDGLILASLATEAILHMKAGALDDNLIVDFQQALESDASLQQAAGVVSEHFKIPITDAMVLIRGKAFGSEYSLAELSRIIVRRELSLEDW
jgi:hypothetical protein